MLGKEFDSATVALGIVLGQILHRLDQQALAFDVAIVALAAMRPPRLAGHHRDHEYLRHWLDCLERGYTLAGRPVDEVYDSFYSASSFLFFQRLKPLYQETS